MFLILALATNFSLLQLHPALTRDQRDVFVEPNTSKRICFCGYKVYEFAKVVLPDYTIDEGCTDASEYNSVLLVGMHLTCDAATAFRGKVIYLNGEATSAETVPGSHYLGPISRDTQRAHQLYYVTLAALQLPGSYTSLLTPRDSIVPEKFLLHISSRCLPHRQEAFDQFSKVAKVTAGGSCHGDDPQLYENVNLKGSWLDLSQAYTDYKFGLVMENTDAPGYVTEKILLAFLGGAVPIYYGTSDVFKLFNREAVVYYEPAFKDKAISEVRHLMEDRVQYMKKRTKPVFSKDAGSKYFLETLESVNLLREKLQLEPLSTTSRRRRNTIPPS